MEGMTTWYVDRSHRHRMSRENRRSLASGMGQRLDPRRGFHSQKMECWDSLGAVSPQERQGEGSIRDWCDYCECHRPTEGRFDNPVIEEERN